MVQGYNATALYLFTYTFTGAGHTRQLPRQRDLVFRPTLLFVITIWLHSLWLLHLDTEAWHFFRIFACHCRTNTLCCGCREAKNLSRAQLRNFVFLFYLKVLSNFETQSTRMRDFLSTKKTNNTVVFFYLHCNLSYKIRSRTYLTLKFEK